MAALVIAIAALCFFSCQKIGALEIRDTKTGYIYGRWPIENHGEFAIEFIHSINMSPARDTFKIQAGKLQLPDGTSFNDVNYIVGTISDHILFINNEIISLKDLCGKNAHITIRWQLRRI